MTQSRRWLRGPAAAVLPTALKWRRRLKRVSPLTAAQLGRTLKSSRCPRWRLCSLWRMLQQQLVVPETSYRGREHRFRWRKRAALLVKRGPQGAMPLLVKQLRRPRPRRRRRRRRRLLQSWGPVREDV